MPRFVYILPLFLAVTPLAEGSIIVGHPLDFRFAGGAGLTHTAGAISVTDEVVTFADNSTMTLAVDAVLHPGDEILIPEGEVVSVRLHLDAPITVSGTGNAGGTYTLSLDAGTIVIDLDPSLVVSHQGTSDADLVELAFPNWVTATSLNLGQGVQRTVAYGHPLHAQLREDVLSDSAILR